MAKYSVTDSPEVNWDDDFTYSYRYRSANGAPVAQDEVERRKAARRPVVLWRWVDNEPSLVEQHYV